MEINFRKYQGTGNDFVIIDNRSLLIDRDRDFKRIKQLCDRKFGIGADGLMLLQARTGYDFEMIYYNADGFEGSMCGNGGRCIVQFAASLGLFNGTTSFLAVDGKHTAYLTDNGSIALLMSDVTKIDLHENDFVLNTGSPHFVRFVNDMNAIDVVMEGRKVRYNDTFVKEGINVNFVTKTIDGIKVATYERGVEDETLSCGTGVTACAIAYFLREKMAAKQYLDYGNITDPQVLKVTTKGGLLEVHFQMEADGTFSNIWLIGAATEVFQGTIHIK